MMIVVAKANSYVDVVLVYLLGTRYLRLYLWLVPACTVCKLCIILCNWLVHGIYVWQIL